MFKIKICGITNLKEAETAAMMGADALGLVIGGSNLTKPVDIKIGQRISKFIHKKCPFLKIVLVTHYTKLSDILNTYKKIDPDIIQIVEDIPLNQIKKIKKQTKLPILKTIRAVDRFFSLKIAQYYRPVSEGFLLDTMTDDKIGDTGRVHDWNISKAIVDFSGKPTILAGGLTVKNIKEAILKVRPFGVDILTGVNDKKGEKLIFSEKKVSKFIQKAKKLLNPELTQFKKFPLD